MGGPDTKSIRQTATEVKQATLPITGTANDARAAWQDWSKWSGKMSGLADIAHEGWFGPTMARAGGSLQELVAGSAPEIAQIRQSSQQQKEALNLMPSTSGDTFLREWLDRQTRAQISGQLAGARERALAGLAGAEQAYLGQALSGGGLAQNYLNLAQAGYGNTAALIAGSGRLQAEAAQAEAQRQANKLKFWGDMGRTAAGLNWFA